MVLASAAVINRNRKDLLIDCLRSLKGQSIQPDEIILIDNASEDDSVRAVSLEFPRVNIIRNDKNHSFAASCNQAIDRARGEFILLLNNDIALDKNFIKFLLGALETDKKIGIAGGKNLSFGGEFIDSAGQLLARSRKIIDRGYGEVNRAQYDKAGYIFGVSAAAALYRRAMLDDIKADNGYFDEDFEFFYEDMDLAWRAKNKGWEAYYEPKAIAYHARGATTKTEKPKFKFLERYYIPHLRKELALCAVRNRYLMMIKNDSLSDILKNLPMIIWYEMKQAVYILLFKQALIIYTFNNIHLFIKVIRKRMRNAV